MRTREASGLAIVGGTVLLLLGVAFLLRNEGLLVIRWSLLWPLLVVGVGAAIIVAAVRSPAAAGTGVSNVSVPADGARRLELALRVGAGRYRLAAGGPGVVEATSAEPTIGQAVERQGDLVRVRLSTAVDPWAWGWRGPIAWGIGVAPAVPTALDVRAGAGEFELDLSALSIVSASIGVGAAELRVVLPRPRGEVPIRIEGGAAGMTVAIPAGVEARVAVTGLVSVSGPTETAGYRAASDRVTVAVSGGISSVRIVAA